MSCTLDFTALPILSGCPGDNEQFLVGNATGGYNPTTGQYDLGYARRIFGDIKTCILSRLVFVPLQFTVGNMGAPIAAGQSQFTIPQVGVLQDSMFITLDGPELPRGLNDRISYGVAYNPTNVVITFDTPVNTGQTYIGHYCYIS